MNYYYLLIYVIQNVLTNSKVTYNIMLHNFYFKYCIIVNQNYYCCDFKIIYENI